MPWICKVKSPWGEKGEKPKEWQLIINFVDYPDLFEFVEEKSDEDLITKWLRGHFYTTINPTDYISNCLILENAIKPEFLEKLRRGV